MTVRYIDKHDVRAFSARAREMIDAAEERAIKAAGPGWLVERKEHASHARAFAERSKAALDELLACLEHSLEADERAQEAETRALLGEDEGEDDGEDDDDDEGA